MMSAYNLLRSKEPSMGVNPVDNMEKAQNNMHVNPKTTGMLLSGGMDISKPSGSGMNPFAVMDMSGDNNMFGMMGIGNYCQYGVMNAQDSVTMGLVKEIVQLTKSVLYPPDPTAPPPFIRRKPPGCKTVFVSGLPENVTEEIIKEIFERCGEILTIRMSRNNFCHIRFANEAFVENAIYFSGYRIVIEKDKCAFTGRLHVDYAKTSDDQYEYECQQKALQEYFRPPTPPPVHYSEHQVKILGEKLGREETFQQAAFVLITWLENGECRKRNVGSFYSMIHSTNRHVRKLMNKKLKYEEELNKARLKYEEELNKIRLNYEKARLMLRQQMQGILLQFDAIGKVFHSACLQRVWDHFTKVHRKNIQQWKKQAEEIKNVYEKEFLNDRIEDDMDLSSNDEEDTNGVSDNKVEDSSEKQKHEDEINKFCEENDTLCCQFDSAQNEMLLRSETVQEKDLREHQLTWCTADQNMKKEMSNLSQKKSKDEANSKEYRAYKSRSIKDSELKDNEDDHIGMSHHGINFRASVSSSSPVPLLVTEREVKLLGLISTCLNVHPFGASIDDICSYLHQVDGTVKARDVENLMRRFPSVFKEESTGIGTSLKSKWTSWVFCFDSM